MPPRLPLRSLLLLAVAGCTNAHTAPEPQPAPAVQPPAPEPGLLVATPGADCPEPGFFLPGADLSPIHGIDSFQIWNRGGTLQAPAVLRHEVGEACSGASDRERCLGELESHTAAGALAGGCQSSGCSYGHFTFTHNDTVGVLDDREAFISWLGTIDTAGEAMTVLWMSGVHPTCTTTVDSVGRYTVLARMETDCPIQRFEVSYLVNRDGTFSEQSRRALSEPGGCVGRLTGGVTPGACGSSLGERLARDAALEATAAVAFSRLARELTTHGAPAHLIDGARRAEQDEVRHAAAIAALAEQHGGTVTHLPLPDAAVRSLEAIAVENAEEGCVREVLGAAIGLLQARQAADPTIRAAMGEIAEEEVQHAEWSLALHRWLTTRLSSAAQARVEAARQAAWADLRAGLEAPTSEATRRAMGLPTAQQAASLIDALTAQAAFSVA